MGLCSALIKVAPPLLGSHSTTALLFSHENHSTHLYTKTNRVSSVPEPVSATFLNRSEFVANYFVRQFFMLF